MRYRYRIVDHAHIVLGSHGPLRDRRAARQMRKTWAEAYPRRRFYIERTCGRGWERTR